jgi:hypothetical protein
MVASVSFLGTLRVTLIMVTMPVTKAMTPVKSGELIAWGALQASY